jgi:hypothetical protein
VFDHAAMADNLVRLVTAVGEDEDWVRTHLEPASVWIDRVLDQHAEIFG